MVIGLEFRPPQKQSNQSVIGTQAETPVKAAGDRGSGPGSGPATRGLSQEVEDDVDEQHGDDDELDHDLEEQGLGVVERFGEGIEDGLDDLDSLIDQATTSHETEPGCECAMDPDRSARRQVSARIGQGALELGQVEDDRLETASARAELK